MSFQDENITIHTKSNSYKRIDQDIMPKSWKIWIVFRNEDILVRENMTRTNPLIVVTMDTEHETDSLYTKHRI